MVSGIDAWTATLAAAAAGVAAGIVTAFLNIKLRILHILAGILTAIALYSINLRIMDRPNIGLLNIDTVYSFVEKDSGSRQCTHRSFFSPSSSSSASS